MSTKADYYETLGVSRNSSEAEIKQAFRKLARQYHPDVNKDADAEARFKDINEAYETLRDPQKRRAYDLFGHSNGRSGGMPRGVDPADMGGIGDIFEAFFGAGARPSARSGPETGTDLRMDLTLDFAEAVFGVERDIEVSRLEACTDCSGSGADSGSKIVTCSACKGQGQVRRMQSNFFGQFTTVATCSRCGGEGRVPTVRCGTCTGSGRTKQNRTISVKIPAGVDSGLRIRLGGQGEAGPRNGPRGDLYVFVNVRPDERFAREDDDIHVDYRVNFAQAALGHTVKVPTLEGDESLDIPPGTQSGSVFTLRRRGVPHLNGGGRGDQHVHVHVDIPQRLSAEQKELLHALSKTFGHNAGPHDDKGFFDKMKDALGVNQVWFGDNLPILKQLPDSSFSLIYIDPPFNTGKERNYTRLRTIPDESGDRVGFKGKRYRTVRVGNQSYADYFDDFMEFLEPRLREAHRLLTSNGTLYFHIDYREVHYCKILLDHIFGRECFLNEVIWAYDYGGRTKRKWPPKHDNILVYVKNPDDYIFNVEAIDRIPYMAPGLVGPEKAARGKLPTDVWWHTIVPTNSKERTGYPTQKPLGILRRIVKASSNPGDTVLDFFAGSGTTGEAAHENGRSFVLVDSNPEALEIMVKRLSKCKAEFIDYDLTQHVAHPQELSLFDYQASQR